jgi:hypothetical protein
MAALKEPLAAAHARERGAELTVARNGEAA